MNPTVEQLGSDGAMAIQRSMMELVGRHPPLGAPGKHGHRVGLFHGLMEAACTGNDNMAHYSPLLISYPAMSAAVRTLEVATGMIPATNAPDSVGAGLQQTDALATQGWGPTITGRGLMEALGYGGLFLFAGVLRETIPVPASTTSPPPLPDGTEIPRDIWSNFSIMSMLVGNYTLAELRTGVPTPTRSVQMLITAGECASAVGALFLVRAKGKRTQLVNAQMIALLY